MFSMEEIKRTTFEKLKEKAQPCMRIVSVIPWDEFYPKCIYLNLIGEVLKELRARASKWQTVKCAPWGGL